MAWLAVDIDGEKIFYSKPFKPHDKSILWESLNPQIRLPIGSIEKLIGKHLTSKDEPVEIKDN